MRVGTVRVYRHHERNALMRIVMVTSVNAVELKAERTKQPLKSRNLTDRAVE